MINWPSLNTIFPAADQFKALAGVGSGLLAGVGSGLPIGQFSTLANAVISVGTTVCSGVIVNTTITLPTH